MHWKIKRAVAETIIEAAKQTLPNEFAALLGGNAREHAVTELIVVPAIFGSEHAIIRTDLLPITEKNVGSVHSHPNHSNRPSPADKKMFRSQGTIHFIVCQPYSFQTLRAFDEKGNPVAFEIEE